MAASFEQLVFEIIARDAQASAAFDRFRRTVDQTTGSVDKNAASLDKQAKSAIDARGAALGAGIAFAAMASPMAAAGLGAAAFASMALPSIVKVEKAITGTGGLGAAWSGLDAQQKTMALGVQALGNRYSQLAMAMEPRTAQVLNTALGVANSLLGPMASLAKGAATGIEQVLAQVSGNSGLAQFLTFAGHEAGPALAMLGSDITGIAHAVFGLLQSFGGAGLTELRLFSDVLNALTASISWLSQHAPGLTNVAISVTGVVLALSKLGMLGKIASLMGISGAIADMKGFAAATEGATVAEKGMLATEVAIDAITPFGWAVLGAAAVGGLVYLMTRADQAEQKLITTTLAMNKAQGFNTAGYKASAAALQQVFDNMTAAQRGGAGRGQPLHQLSDSAQELTGEIAALNAGVGQQNALLTTLQQKYGITRAAAVSLAQAAGVQVDKNGQLTGGLHNAIAVTEAFGNANLAAQRPVMGLANAVAMLTADMKANVTATLTLQGDEIAWRQALDAASKQLASNSAGLSGNSANALANKAAVLAATQAAVSFANDQLTLHGNLRQASADIQAQIDWLRKHGGASAFARQEIHALLAEEAKIKGQIGTTVTVTGHGSWFVGPGGKAMPMGAQGLLVTSGTTPTADDVLARVSRGELIVPQRMVAAGMVDHLRGLIPGFAGGGVAGQYDGSVPGLTSWLKSESSATVTAIAMAVAGALSAVLRAGPGAPGLSGPGGGAPGANAALARAMMPAWSGGSAWAAWNYVAMRESGWDQFARNPSSGAYGIPQALPPSKLPFAGQAAGGSHPGAQIGWMIGYMQGAYGGPLGAAAHERAFGWYDHGGWLPPGLSLAYNGTGRPEPVGAGVTISVGSVVLPGVRNIAEFVKELQDYARNNGGIKLKIRS